MQVGNYYLLRLLGQGGFADVYLGEHVDLHTQAALKIMRTQVSDQYSQRLLHEARMIAHLHHPNIIPVHDFSVHNGTPFFVMSYAPHGNIRTICTDDQGQGVPLTFESIVRYTSSAARALQYAHDKGIIHRDVKPENMLLHAENELWLSDFGIATFSDKDQQHLRDIAGTVEYMAPEQLQGYPCPASDQYALGIIVYEWLCGTLPFQGSQMRVAVQHVMTAPPSLCKQRADITPRMESIIFKALAKDPHNRFPSIIEFSQTLNAALQTRETVLNSAPAATHALIGRTRQFPLVGRSHECSELHQALLHAEHYIGSVDNLSDTASELSWVTPARAPLHVLTGDAGMGKTRLAEETGREAHQRGWTILWSRAYMQESAPYQLWIDLLRQVMKQNLWFDSSTSADTLPPIYQPLTILLPELALLADTQQTAGAPYTEMAALKIWDAILAVITHTSKQEPILIVLDDLQWADQSSCEVLSYLCRHLVEYPVTILGTYREKNTASKHPFRAQLAQLLREALVNVIHLSALTDQHISQMVASSIKIPEIVQHIQDLATGNPFFAEELTRMINKRSTEDPSTDRLTIPLPQKIASLFEQRLNQLHTDCLTMLQAGAVLGGSFSFSTIIELYQRYGKQLDEDAMLNLLEEALQAGLLTEEDNGQNILFHCWHPLLTQHIYDSIFAARRSILHKRTSQILQKEFSNREEEGAALVVYHLLQGGGEPAPLVHYAQLAGHRAYTLLAYTDAERYYRLAIQYLEICINDHSHPTIDESQQLAEFQEYLAECLRIQGQFKEAGDIYIRILEIHQQQILPTEPEERVQDIQIQAILLGNIGQNIYNQGNVEQAHKFYQQGEALLKSENIISGAALSYLYFAQSYAYWLSGTYIQAKTIALQACILLEDAIAQQKNLCERQNISDYSPLRRFLNGNLINLANIYMLLGILDSATSQYASGLQHIDKAFKIYEQENCKPQMAIACGNIANIYIKQANFAQALLKLEQGVLYAKNIKHMPLTTYLTSHIGQVKARCGDLIEAEIKLQHAQQILDHFDNSLAKAIVYNYSSPILTDQGQFSASQEKLLMALIVVRHLHSPSYTGYALIAFSYLRLMQAKALDNHSESINLVSNEKGRLLHKAKSIAAKLLSTEGVEIDIKCEGKTILAEVILLQGEHEQACAQAQLAQQEVMQLGILWLAPRLARIVGCSLNAMGHYDQALLSLEKSIELAKEYGMQLEHARSLYSYACILLRQHPHTSTTHNVQALHALQEAYPILVQSKALTDLQKVNYLLAQLSDGTHR